MMSTLATAAVRSSRGSLGEFLLYVGLAVVLVVGAGVVLVLYRRRVLADGTTDARARMLEELRAMRDRGDLAPGEYEAARRATIGRVREPRPAGKAQEPEPSRTGGVPPGPDRVAAPGFDLTGAPLPRPDAESPRD